jgi:DNA-binding NarL/FixJ family response regulator
MNPTQTQPNPTMKQAFSAREFEVLELIARGCKNREIARFLTIKERTIRFHIENILDKLGVKNRTEAACVALKMGWIDNEKT